MEGMACAIADIDVLVLRAETVDPQDLDTSAETVVVRIVDEEGRVGIGEADGPPEVVGELVLMADSHAIARGLGGLLMGRDPFQIDALHDELRAATLHHGGRGLSVIALSAVDVALHDLAAKQLGRPAYHLLGGARRARITPYATIYPGAVKERTLSEVMNDIIERLERALEVGFGAMKIEVLFGDPRLRSPTHRVHPGGEESHRPGGRPSR
jgi:L-alanine-DL-glutamate epimerase-like enolase superfamily enzyme